VKISNNHSIKLFGARSFRQTGCVRESLLLLRKTAMDLPHLDAADSVKMAAKYGQ
jgi:hypothetical protein